MNAMYFDMKYFDFIATGHHLTSVTFNKFFHVLIITIVRCKLKLLKKTFEFLKSFK